MPEYTITFPVNLGQKVWVNHAILPLIDLKDGSNVPNFLVGEIRGLMIQSKGNTERKSMKIRIRNNWYDEDSKKYIDSYKYFKFSVGAIGKTIFDKEPNDDVD